MGFHSRDYDSYQEQRTSPFTHLDTLWKGFSLENSTWLMWQRENLKGQLKLSKELLSTKRTQDLQNSHKLTTSKFCRGSQRHHIRSVIAAHLRRACDIYRTSCPDTSLWNRQTLVQWQRINETKKLKISNVLLELKTDWGNLVVEEEKYLPSTSQTQEGNFTQES